jgi:acylpyruvate hydrolase
MKQDGNTKDMIFRIPYLISYISNIVTLEEGDLILTGTPAGVSTVTAGQQITAGLNEIVEMSFSVSN